ncbi:glycosyltransferase [Salinisphaera sp. T31B1]|uniref:glycosyltransferase n=1 Tax=Salinisphaera sp. T31B1 TaxID=727963 RepID=UPI0033423B57
MTGPSHVKKSLSPIDRDQTEPAALAIYIPTLAGGGAELSMLRLAGALAERGYRVDLLLNRRRGAYVARIPAEVNVVELSRYNKWRARLDVWRAEPADLDVVWRPVLAAKTPIMSLRYLGGVADYLEQQRPAVLISALFYTNLLAVWARALAATDTRVVVTEHNALSRRIAEGCKRAGEMPRWRHLGALIGRVYARADAIVTVSDGVGDDLAATAGLARDEISTIYNPVVSTELAGLAAAPVDHPWFARAEPPVLLAVGRLEPQKGFDTLLEALAAVRAHRPVRLMILGEGGQREALSARARELGIADDVSLGGWVDNPYAYMARAAAFVLSSVWEGLGNVLIEAMACGCPVVATDCPYGPREILAGGRHGRLVPVGDVRALAGAIVATLDGPPAPAALRERAAAFSTDRSADRYAALIENLTQPAPI